MKAAYRIIDANFNRAREALRVIEDYCRFAMDSSLLTERTKNLRHKLCEYISRLDSDALIACRDTTNDVGTAEQIASKKQPRDNLQSILIAACKRLPEALRATSEAMQTIDAELAEQIEPLRYEFYTLEKDIVCFAKPAEKFASVRLYVIITSDLPAEVVRLTTACCRGQADCIQFRSKNLPDDQLLALAKEFVEICKSENVVSIINDRADIAIAAGADGVHLGQNDISITQAQKLQLRPMIIGISTHSTDELKSAIEKLPTYAALGPAFSTSTKPDLEIAGIDYIKQASRILADTGIASVAIGGIDLENIDSVLAAGAKSVAICDWITNSPDPEGICRQIKGKIANFGNR